jgi:hypothetical protein
VGSLKIIDVSVHIQEDKRWCGLPARPVLGPDGTVQRDQRGRARWVQIMEWVNKETADRFRQAVFDAVERDYPDALIPK